MERQGLFRTEKDRMGMAGQDGSGADWTGKTSIVEYGIGGK